MLKLLQLSSALKRLKQGLKGCLLLHKKERTSAMLSKSGADH